MKPSLGLADALVCLNLVSASFKPILSFWITYANAIVTDREHPALLKRKANTWNEVYYNTISVCSIRVVA